MTIETTKSKVAFLNGDREFSYEGISYKEAIVASPLVEEGSGQGLGHPETLRTFAVKKNVRVSIPCWRKDVEELDLQVRPVGEKLSKGEWVVRLVKGNNQYKILQRWESEMHGMLLEEAEVKWNPNTNMLNIKLNCLELLKTDAEKFRGFGKWRGNGGFLKNILITQGNLIIFDPNSPLKDSQGNVVQCEHVIGGEEYKTLTYAIGMLAEQLPNGAKWDASTGKWENQEQLESLITNSARRVTVNRWNIEPSVYYMLKELYSEDSNFTFVEEEFRVVQQNVWCWAGTQTNIVEVPLTRTFMGRCSLFAEHIHYLGTEFPALYNELLSQIATRQKMVEEALLMALGEIPGATEANPFGRTVVIDAETLILEGKKVIVDLAEEDEDGTVFVNSITIPGELDLNSLTRIHALLVKKGYCGVTLMSVSSKGNECVFPINLDLFRRLNGTTAQNAARSLIEILLHLEVELEDRGYDNWHGHFYRLTRLVESSVEYLVGDSPALIAKATKTTEIAFTCRIGGTIDASVKRDELHIHTHHAKTWGLEEKDIVIPGRVPVPGMGTLRVVLNDAVPYGTVVTSSATQHAIQEGDQDGDSTVFLAFSPEGKLRIPPQRGRAVNPIAD